MNENRVEYLSHIGVMQKEILSILDSVPPGIFIDATYGYGSHFLNIKSSYKKFDLYGFDRDIESISNSSEKVYKLNFSEIPKFLNNNDIKNISGIFYDFGISSHQVDSYVRGFSYINDGPLDMRMDTSNQISAYTVVNSYSVENLAKILFENGEEKNSKRIAKSIVENRPLGSTLELSAAIKSAITYKNPKYVMSTVKRCFQALRIYINNELEEIEKSLNEMSKFIISNGVIICISYHSLEDRIVKKYFQKLTKGCICDPNIAVCICDNKNLFNYGKKRKLTPSLSEINSNSRSSSAILRYVVKNEN